MPDKLAIHGGAPVRGPEQKWPAWPVFDDLERRAVLEVLDSGKWWFGERVAQFEAAYAAFQDARHAITCASGTSALEIALRAAGVGPGDEVLVPPYTFIATASAAAYIGAKPVFVDVDATWNMNPDLVEAAITDRTKAIVPVHFGGLVADMDYLSAIAEDRGVALIEDACHSWGGKWKGKGTGALGLGGVFSFQMSKNITAAEGGAIVSDDDAFAEAARSIANCGRGGDSGWYGHVRVGTNSRMTEFQAAILSAQLTRLEAQTLHRERNGAYLDGALADVEGLIPQPADERVTRRAYHLYCLRIVPEEFGCSRAQFCKAAQAEGFPVGPGYGMPLYAQRAFLEGPHGAEYVQCTCPMAEDLCYTSGMWALHDVLLGTQEDMADIAAICRKIKRHAHALDGE